MVKSKIFLFTWMFNEFFEVLKNYVSFCEGS